MKKITIYQSSCDAIEIEDDSNIDLVSFAKKIATIMKSDRLKILEFGKVAIIVKPSKISSIRIEDIQTEEILEV